MLESDRLLTDKRITAAPMAISAQPYSRSFGTVTPTMGKLSPCHKVIVETKIIPLNLPSWTREYLYPKTTEWNFTAVRSIQLWFLHALHFLWMLSSKALAVG